MAHICDIPVYAVYEIHYVVSYFSYSFQFLQTLPSGQTIQLKAKEGLSTSSHPATLDKQQAMIQVGAAQYFL